MVEVEKLRRRICALETVISGYVGMSAALADHLREEGWDNVAEIVEEHMAVGASALAERIDRDA